MPSKAELLDYLLTKLKKNEEKKANTPKFRAFGDRLLSPDSYRDQNSVSKPGNLDQVSEVEGAISKALPIAGAITNPVGTIAGMGLEYLKNRLFPEEDSVTDSLIPDPETGELKVAGKAQSVVPRWTKVRRKAVQTIQKFPTKEDYIDYRKNPGLYTGSGRDDWGEKMDTSRYPLRPSVTDPGKIQITANPTRDYVQAYLDGKPAAAIALNTKGKVDISESAQNARGKGVGKELYKYLGQQGKNIFEVKDTSIAAARARYSAIKDLAEGKFSKVKALPYSAVNASQRTGTGIDPNMPKPEVSTKNLVPDNLISYLSTQTKRNPNRPTTAKNFDVLAAGSPKIQALKRGVASKKAAEAQPRNEGNTSWREAERQIEAKSDWTRRLLRLLPSRLELTPDLVPERSDLRTRLLNKLDDASDQINRVSSINSGGVSNETQEYLNRLPQFRTLGAGGFSPVTELSKHTDRTRALIERLQQLLRAASHFRGENYESYYGPRDFK